MIVVSSLGNLFSLSYKTYHQYNNYFIYLPIFESYNHFVMLDKQPIQRCGCSDNFAKRGLSPRNEESGSNIRFPVHLKTQIPGRWPLYQKI